MSPAVDDGRDAVVVLDAAARVIGHMDKLAAHQRATRHLAFSVVLLDGDGAMVLQRRAGAKYHFAGRWSNACCSHPRPGEPIVAAARRRVREELGVGCDALAVHGAFWYEAHDPVSGLTEHEYDVVLLGSVSGAPDPDPAEVAEVAHRDPGVVRAALAVDPQHFTPWLPRVLDVVDGPATPIAVGLIA